MGDHTFHIYFTIFTLEFCARCFMALIRGGKSKFPCPICLVPDTQMSDGSTHPLRTTESMQKVLEVARAMPSKEREEHLKGYGLRNVEVCKLC